MKTDIKYNNNILNIKIDGIFVGRRVSNFEEEVIPIVLSLNAKNVNINMSNLELIDKKGIESIIKVSNIVNRFKGKVVLCELNDYIKQVFKNTDIFDYCFKSKNDKTSKEVFKI